MARVPLVREATETDFEALTKLDLSYTVGERYLDLERSGSEPELSFSMRWRTGAARERVYDTLTVDSLREARKRVDAFFVAEVDCVIAGYEMIVKQQSHHAAAQITDLAPCTGRRAEAGPGGRWSRPPRRGRAIAACVLCGLRRVAKPATRSTSTSAPASA